MSIQEMNTKNNQKIINIKESFNAIKERFHEINNMFNSINTKKNKLQEIYNRLLHENTDTLFVFGLDSFNFQTKIIIEESKSLETFYNLISNRIFCDYFKLNRLIYDYIIKEIDNKKIKDKVTQHYTIGFKYDYLDIYKGYDIQKTNDVFINIISMIVELLDYSKIYVNELESYKKDKKSGISINNFIYTYEYKCTVLEQQIQLFLNYITFFLKLHNKYLTRFMRKLVLIYEQINRDIKFEDKQFFDNNPSSSRDNSILSPKVNSDNENSGFNILYSNNSSDSEDSFDKVISANVKNRALNLKNYNIEDDT